MTTSKGDVVVAAVMATVLLIFLQLILFITSWFDGITLYRWICFALTCWIALLNGSYALILYGNYTKKAHGNKRQPTEHER